MLGLLPIFFVEVVFFLYDGSGGLNSHNYCFFLIRPQTILCELPKLYKAKLYSRELLEPSTRFLQQLHFL